MTNLLLFWPCFVLGECALSNRSATVAKDETLASATGYIQLWPSMSGSSSHGGVETLGQRRWPCRLGKYRTAAHEYRARGTTNGHLPRHSVRWLTRCKISSHMDDIHRLAEWMIIWGNMSHFLLLLLQTYPSLLFIGSSLARLRIC